MWRKCTAACRLHVDAAYAGVLGILPEMRHHFTGLELADSFSTNAHKWLLTNFDCSCMWIRDAQYVRAALSLLPAYLRSRGNDHDYKVRHALRCVHGGRISTSIALQLQVHLGASAWSCLHALIAHEEDSRLLWWNRHATGFGMVCRTGRSRSAAAFAR